MLHRRSFIRGLVGLVAAPAIVKASSLMPVRSFANDEWDRITAEIAEMLTRPNYILHDNPDFGPDTFSGIEVRDWPYRVIKIDIPVPTWRRLNQITPPAASPRPNA